MTLRIHNSSKDLQYLRSKRNLHVGEAANLALWSLMLKAPHQWRPDESMEALGERRQKHDASIVLSN